MGITTAGFDKHARKQKSAEEIEEHNRAAVQQLFVIKKHWATRLHYDFRLGWNRVLKSWAVPEGPGDCPSHSREAIQVEDHSREYLAFEGVIPKGRPGAGPTMPWDWGTWKPSAEYLDVESSLRNGCLKFTLYGEKLKGDWTLVRRPGGWRNGLTAIWDLIKEPDQFARSEAARSILEEKPNSVSSGKSLEEVERSWTEGKSKREPGATLFETEE